MSDNRTTELPRMQLHRLLEKHDVDYWCVQQTTFWNSESGSEFLAYQYQVDGVYKLAFKGVNVTPEQAIAATLSRPKAKAHPYGYEPDTDAFDCTRCECGCINDISATYCNDCGGEIEIDMYAEKEIYHIPCHLVFAEKHDDGSIEFGGKRYVAVTLGSFREKRLEKLARSLYASYHAEWPDRAEEVYADCMEELGIEVGE